MAAGLFNKFDASGNLVWQKDYGEDNRMTWLEKLP